MSDDMSLDRRSFVKFAGGAAATVSLAGCSGGDGGDGSSGSDGSDGGDGSSGSGSGGSDGSDGGDGEDTVPEQFQVTITQGQPPTTLDPQNHRSTPTDNVVLQAYEGVLGRSASGEIQKKLATGFERVEDGLIRFDIREDVTFHNGDSLTPEDVAYSINRIVKKSVGLSPSPQRDQLAGVTGASVVDGERAVEVESDGLNPVVFSLFASYGDIMEKSWVESSDTDPSKEMNGTGPFKLSSYKEGVEVVMERYSDYWRDLPDISQLTFRASKSTSTRVNQLLEGETDVIVNVPPQEVSRVRNSESASLAAASSTRIIFSAMRYDVEPFSNKQFRQAMNYAVDLEGIIKNVLDTFGDATGQPTLDGFVGYNDDVGPYSHDKAKAEQLVEESGHAGAEIELHTPVGRYLKDVEIAQAVGSQIDSLSNVSCTVKQREFASLAGEVTDGNIETAPHFYLLGWGNATFDASQTILPLLTGQGALTSYSNEEVNSTMSAAQSEGDRGKRKELLHEANKMLHDNAPWVYLNRQYSVYGVSNRLEWKARSDERIAAYTMEKA